MTFPLFYDKPTLDSLLGAKLNSVSVAVVALSGSYGDLTNKPFIPATASDVSAVPTTRKVNGHALTGDLSLVYTDLTGLIPLSGLAPGSVIYVKKDPTSGFWPAAWNADGSPNYAGGSASAGVRPTARADVMVIWKGADPSPNIVTTGTAGMLDGSDERHVL